MQLNATHSYNLQRISEIDASVILRDSACKLSKGRYPLPTFTGHVNSSWTWLVHTGVILDTRIHGASSHYP